MCRNMQCGKIARSPLAGNLDTRRKMRSYTTVLAAFLLSACASVNVPHDYTLEETREEGLLVVSVSGEGLAKEESPVWQFRRSDGTRKGEIITGYLREPLDWKDPPGRLAYIALAPGRYEFYEAGFARQVAPAATYWTIGPGGIPTSNNPSYAGFNAAQYASLNAQPFVFPFEIVPGKATYVGNLHFIWDDAKRKGTVVLRDGSERDLTLLQQRLPHLRANQIRHGP